MQQLHQIACSLAVRSFTLCGRRAVLRSAFSETLSLAVFTGTAVSAIVLPILYNKTYVKNGAKLYSQGHSNVAIVNFLNLYQLAMIKIKP